MLFRRSSLGLRACLVWSSWVAALQAAEPSHATREYRVEFQADHVQVDGDLGALELDGNVWVQAQRYRLKSQHLRLHRGPRGVEAEGTADVAFCTCDEPPVRLRVAHATLAPPTDALFVDPRLEVWGLPVFWLPGLWLRAPTRFGLTFPRASYRGEDGFFVGGGAYAPLQVLDGRVTKSLTLGAGAYLLRGARIDAELDTETGTSRVAWDHLRQTALEVDAHGSAAMSDATLAYRVDALRGGRAGRVSSSLDLSARRTDRARISVSHVDQVALGFGVRADAARSGALRDLGSVGPELYLGAAGGLGDSISYDAFALSRSSVIAGNHGQTELLQRGSLGAQLRPGPLGIDLTAAQSGQLRVAEYRSQGLLRGGVQARVGLPLLREFGSISHFVEPMIIGRGLVDAAPRGSELNGERTLLATGGLDSSLGQRSTRQALALGLRAGVLQHAGSATFVGVARTHADTHWVGGVHSFALLGASRTMVSLSRLRLGSGDGLHLLLRADGASRGSPARARVLFDESWFDPALPFLDRNGWSAGSELSLPWSRAFSTTASVDYDLSARELLAAWGGLGYRHPCGCLAVASFVGHRVGRGGFDAWIGFDLAP